MGGIRKPKAEQVGSQHPLKNRKTTPGSMWSSEGTWGLLHGSTVLVGGIHPPVVSGTEDFQCSAGLKYIIATTENRTDELGASLLYIL